MSSTPQRRDAQRDKSYAYPTPLLEDVLLIEERDQVLEKFPAYGESHPESFKYPNHFLVFIEENQGKTLWYWAADRENQDEYNYTISYPFSGLTSCPRIERTYVVRRDSYEPLAIGTADPLHASTRPEHALFASALLVEEKTQRISKEFDSHYIVVVRVYETVPSVEAQLSLNLEISYPWQNQRAYPRYTRRLVIPRATYASLAALSADPVYSSAVLTVQRMTQFEDESAKSRYVLDTRIYDTHFSPSMLGSYSSEIHHQVPSEFLVRTDRLETTGILAPSVATPAPTGGDPVVGFSQLAVSARPLEMEAANMEKAGIQFRFVTGDPLTGWEMDPYTGKLMPFTRTLVAPGTAGEELNSEGEYSEVEPRDQNYSIKITRKVTSMAGAEGDVVEYETHLHHAWPPVLLGIYSYQINRQFKYWLYLKEGYAGPCRAVITETFHTTAPTVSDPIHMVPSGARVDLVTTTFSLPSCLHAGFTVTEIRSGQGGSFYIPPTNYTDWPATIPLLEVHKTKGGYLKRVTTIYKPPVVYPGSL